MSLGSLIGKLPAGEDDDGVYGRVEKSEAEDLAADETGGAGEDDFHNSIMVLGGEMGNYPEPEETPRKL